MIYFLSSLLITFQYIHAFSPHPIFKINQIIPCNQINNRRFPTQLNSWTDSFNQLLQGGTFDQFIQGALNSATGTEAQTIGPVVVEEIKGGLNLLGRDLLAFLFATITIVPLFKFLGESPVIGFLGIKMIYYIFYTAFFPFVTFF